MFTLKRLASNASNLSIFLHVTESIIINARMQVEAILLEHPGIVSAVVIGVIDVRLGEMVVACVRLRENWIWSDVEDKHKRDFKLSSEALKRFCRIQNLTG